MKRILFSSEARKQGSGEARFLLTGGGTGGHIMPLLAVAEKLPQESKILILGSNIKDISFPYKNVLAGKWRRYFSLKNFIDIFKGPIGMLQAFWHVFWFMPDVCFGKGGYASVPAVFACWLLRIPIILHESDTIPGIANRLLAKFAKKVCVSFEQARKYFTEKKVVFTGNPVRKQIFQGKEIQKDRPLVLVLGGSQGAQYINEVITAILPSLLRKADVVHQSGLGKKSEVVLPGYEQYEFIKNIEDYYKSADVIISRAGANTLAEIAVLKKPVILVPLPKSSFEHQRENAYVFAKAKAAIVIEQNNLGPYLLRDKIFQILNEPLASKKMGEHASDLNPPDAAERIIQEILKLC